jgi:hypothetical protein
MMIEKIVHAEQRRLFSIAEARALLPLIYHITESSHKKVKILINRLEAAKGQDMMLMQKIEEMIGMELSRWQSKLGRLGIVPKGMWLADFDNGSSYYCWKFPETDIRFCHAYQDGFTGRVEIQEIQ